MKLVVIILTSIFHSFYDWFGIMYYYEHVGYLLQGQIPYIQFDYEYPILVFIPSLIAMIPSFVFGSKEAFVFTFSGLMVICDCITTVCIYLIAKKIWDDEFRAYVAALVYTTAISAMYFVLFEYSSSASCILMLTLTAVVYGKDFLIKDGGYLGLTIGFFIKAYPAFAVPFVAFYHAHTTSLKAEIIRGAKSILPVVAVLLVPFVIFNLSSLKTYIPARLEFNYFPNTIIWTVHVWLHDILGINVSQDIVMTGIYAGMICIAGALLYAGYKYPEKDAKVMLQLTLGLIMVIVLGFKVRSPQYIVWFTPFLCILIVDDIRKVMFFYFTQILAFVEFPLTFWSFWTNVEYTNPLKSMNWTMTLLFFTVEFGSLVLLVWWVIDPVSIYKKIRSAQVS
jgi:hypothetical protein